MCVSPRVQISPLGELLDLKPHHLSQEAGRVRILPRFGLSELVTGTALSAKLINLVEAMNQEELRRIGAS